jgi:general secretion pathway protein H
MQQISATGPTARDGGFTLLEVLVAMAIVSLATLGLSLAWPHWIETGATQRAMTELTSFIAATRDEAVSSSSPLAVTYDAASRRLIASNGHILALPGKAHLTLEGNPNQSPRIAFFPDGSSSGGRVKISLADRNYTLRVDQLTGSLHE